MSKISDKHNLACGSSIWIQASRLSRKFVLVECHPDLFKEPQLTWCKSKSEALDKLADRLEADVMELE